LIVGLLGRLQVTPRGLALHFRGASVGGDVAEALLDREFVDYGGAFVRGAGRVMAMQLALTRLLVTLMRVLGVLGGASHVFLRDGLSGGEFCPPAQQLLGASGGLFTR